jgi:hypothetical protein
MPNPTGTTYLAANPSYVWANGDVYEIQQTDESEGAATDASFSALGVDNQPHQVLLNKVNYLYSKMQTDLATVATLQSLVNLMGANVGAAGYLKLGSNDTVLGAIQLIVEWGSISLAAWGPGGANVKQGLSATLITSFPFAYPNKVFLLIPYWQMNTTVQDAGRSAAATGLEQTAAPSLAVIMPTGSAPYSTFTTSFIVYQEALASGPGVTPAVLGITGIGWLALGY